jgi:hypothetical protein
VRKSFQTVSLNTCVDKAVLGGHGVLLTSISRRTRGGCISPSEECQQIGVELIRVRVGYPVGAPS